MIVVGSSAQKTTQSKHKKDQNKHKEGFILQKYPPGTVLPHKVQLSARFLPSTPSAWDNTSMQRLSYMDRGVWTKDMCVTQHLQTCDMEVPHFPKRGREKLDQEHAANSSESFP